MENVPRKSLHPLIAAAAVAVIVLSAVGISAITGLIPTSKSTQEQPSAPLAQPGTPNAALQPTPAPAEAYPQAAHPAKEQPRPRAAAPAPAKPAAVHRPAPAVIAEPQPAPVQTAPREPVQVAAAERSAPPPPAPVCFDCGTVESIRELKQAGEGSGVGAVAGGVAGAVLGHQVGGGRGRDIATVVGAVGGAVAGHQVEKQVKSSVVYEITVRMNDGSVRTITEPNPPTWRAGDRVRVQDGRLTTQG
jgi:outer membrane lipoprotein SlyB